MEYRENNRKYGNKLRVFKFDINKKYKLTRREKIISLISGILALLIAFSVIAIKRKSVEDANRQQIIEQFYEENELEQRIRSYIKISNELNNLKLNKYDISDNMFIQYGIGDELKSPEQLNGMIEQFKKSSVSFDRHDLIQNNDITRTILTLKKQEELVNSYIFTTGYEVANVGITKATKEMAAETFGLDSENITFAYMPPTSSDPDVVRMEVKDSKGRTSIYQVKDKMFDDIGENIISGVRSMVNTNTGYDHDKNDNNTYNEARNNRIENAMNKTALFMNEVNTKDLYDEDLNKDFNAKKR